MSLIITRGFGPENEMTAIPVILSVECVAPTTVRVTFLEPFRLESPADTSAGWSIEPRGHTNGVTILSLSYQDNIIDLTTTEHKDSLRYVLNIPNLGILDGDMGGRYPGPFRFEYGGVSAPPFIVIVKGVDQTAIDVVYSEEVVTEEALVAENYTLIGPGDVKVLSVEKINEITYRLRTTRQTRLVEYTVAVENIHDLAGNAIVSDHQ